MKIEFSVLQEQAIIVQALIRELMQALNTDLALGMHWIHVESWTTGAQHFVLSAPS